MKRFRNMVDNEDMGVTVVSNAFINHFMTKASGDYVRVYLYGLKYADALEEEFPSDDKIAEVLDTDKKTVQDAWLYWQEEGILRLEDDGVITYINIAYRLFGNPLTPGKARKSKKSTSRKVTEMFNEIESRISRPLGISEHDVILDWIDEYKFTPQTVLLIIEYCLTREGGRNIGYWIAVADNLHADGITTYDETCSYFDKRTANYKRNKEIMDYLGFYRSPTEPETKLIKKWYDEYALDIDTIKKACDETIKTGKPNLKYIDTVLTAWHEGKDIKPTQQSPDKKTNKKTRLKDEHNYDVDALQKALFGEDADK